MKKIISTSILFITLTACNNVISNGMSKERIYDKFEDELICSFSNYMFIDSNNYDLFIELNNNNEVGNYIKYKNKKISEKAFNELENNSIDEVINKIGIPSFCGYQEERKTLFYVDDIDFYYLILEEKNNNLYVEEKYNNKDDWFMNMVEPNKKDKPNKDLVDKVYKGMPIEDLYFILGRPEKDVGSGGYILVFELNTGEKLYTVMKQNNQKYNEYKEDNIVQSCHFLEIADFYIK